jgi:YVTN family beta-propeller protein
VQPARRSRRSRRSKSPFLVVAAATIGAAALGVWLIGERKTGRQPAATTHAAARSTPASQPAPKRRLRTPSRLTEQVTGQLPAPLQDPSVASLATGRALLLGGLTAADQSTDEILRAGARGARVIGHLPSARHDTAAVTLGRYAYVFGGGTPTSQLDEIVRVDPVSGAASVVAHLPAASSDSTAAAIGGSAYVVGGYTGTHWLDTIVVWRPGSGARVVAHLPATLRYTAVTAVGDRLVIAGGSLENGSASSAVWLYTPSSRRLSRLGSLPAPTTHAAAATLGNVAYVIGGRGASLGTQTRRIVAVDPRSHRITVSGSLAAARSDLGAATAGHAILLAGGAGTTGTLSTLGELRAAIGGRAPRLPPHTVAAGNIYRYDRVLSTATRGALSRIYVPNSRSDTVDVIDPRTYKVVDQFAVGGLPQHVVPAWDLKTLYVTNDTGNSLTPINPRTGKPGKEIPVTDPYNMYFTPNGRYAIVVAERLHRLDFRDAHTFRLHHSLPMPCVGVDHIDFSADERYLIASCEFSGQLVKVNVARERVVGVLTLPDGSTGMPQDVKLSPDGKTFYVADMMAGGLWKLDGRRFRVTGFVRTGAGVHGLYPSRDAKYLYATNRGEGSISVIAFRTGKVVAKWRIPGGGSPDMGGVSANGRVLWLSGRYNGVVYAISTHGGRLLAKIPVGSGPHGLSVWPQPGRYSLGHTGILR